MTLTDLAIWAELKSLILNSAVMINDEYEKEEIIEKLMEAIQLMDDNPVTYNKRELI